MPVVMSTDDVRRIKAAARRRASQERPHRNDVRVTETATLKEGVKVFFSCGPDNAEAGFAVIPWDEVNAFRRK